MLIIIPIYITQNHPISVGNGLFKDAIVNVVDKIKVGKDYGRFLILRLEEY